MVAEDMTEVKQKIANGALAQSGLLNTKSVELAAAVLQRLIDTLRLCGSYLQIKTAYYVVKLLLQTLYPLFSQMALQLQQHSY